MVTACWNRGTSQVVRLVPLPLTGYHPNYPNSRVPVNEEAHAFTVGGRFVAHY